MRTTRKRSAAITLVLAGSAALSGCGEPESQRDVYTKLDDCSKDWGNPAQCEPVRDGKYSNTYFYGPRYYGASFPSGRPRPSPNALEAAYAGRGGVTQLARATSGSGSGGIYAHNTSTVSRSGFGSSARAASGGG
ncbi:MAG: hypothetical protein JSS40_14800 [Proteobacteria bacterium]|nr:hypothetical protein [Pseudomonadota bacterium]